MEKKLKIYKEGSLSIVLSIAIFHLLYFLSLVNSEVFRPQYILFYLTIVAFLFFNEVVKNAQFIIFFGVFSLWCFLCLVFKGGNLDVFYNILYFFSLFIIIQFYSCYKIGLKLHWFLVVGYFLFIMFNIMKGSDPNQILYMRSQNMVGFYMFCYVIMFYTEEYKLKMEQSDNERANVIPALLNLIIALYAFGRSGIIIAIMLLLFVLFNYLKESTTGKKILYSLISISFLLFVYLQFAETIDLLLDFSFSRFSKEGVNLTGREDIWTKYIYYFNESYRYRFFGVPLDADIEFLYYDRNLHNSYLALHSYTGLGALVILGILIRCFFVKGKLFLKMLLIVLLLRAFSDSVLFVSFNDYILYTLIFLILPLKAKRII